MLDEIIKLLIIIILTIILVNLICGPDNKDDDTKNT